MCSFINYNLDITRYPWAKNAQSIRIRHINRKRIKNIHGLFNSNLNQTVSETKNKKIVM